MFIFTNCTYKWPGGAENLAYLVIRQLFLTGHQSVKIFGKEDSYLVKRLREEKIGFFFFDIDDAASYGNVDKSDVLVLFSNYYGLRYFKKANCRVLVWDVLTHSMLTWNRLQFLKNMYGADVIRNAFNRALIGHLYKKNALVCMDASTKQDLCLYLHREIDIKIIQVPIQVQLNRYAFRDKKNLINITYIGRGDEIWKVAPVKKIVSDLIDKSYDVNIHVFTSRTELFEKELASIKKGNVAVTYYTGYYGDRLHCALLETSDVNFSMGMSALESAALGIPTILIDPSMDDYPEGYMYRWLFDSREYSLGEFVSSKTPIKGYLTIDDVLQTVMDARLCAHASDFSYRYVQMNHATEVVLRKFLEHTSFLTFKEMSRFMPNLWI